MIDEIRQSIIELEKKNYKIDEILLSNEVLQLFANSFNKIYGNNALELTGINTIFGYEAGVNLFDNRPVVFRVSIGIENILGSDKE